jgi:four helix bundle protein
MSEFRELVAWQRGMALARAGYELTSHFPRSEMFGLSQQLRKACVSVPCNIAEGHGRWHRKEFSHFLSISHGSLNEVETLLDLSEMLGYVSRSALIPSRALATETGKLLSGLRKSLRGDY